MAVGDVVAWMSNIAALGTIFIQPNAPEEWAIHNIYHEAEVKIRINDEEEALLFDEQNAKGSWSAYPFHLTATHFLTVQNTNASSKLISFDGIVSK